MLPVAPGGCLPELSDRNGTSPSQPNAGLAVSLRMAGRSSSGLLVGIAAQRRGGMKWRNDRGRRKPILAPDERRRKEGVKASLLLRIGANEIKDAVVDLDLRLLPMARHTLPMILSAARPGGRRGNQKGSCRTMCPSHMVRDHDLGKQRAKSPTDHFTAPNSSLPRQCENS